MPKYASSEQTYDALIAAAGELAAEQGFANVSTRAIAARAGVNVSSIHYHFGGKEGLFKAVLRRIIANLYDSTYEQAIEPYRQELDTPQGQARAMAAMVRRHVAGFFDKEKPWWYSKVMYQALQYDSELYRLVYNEYIEPTNAVAFELLERIQPGMSREDKALFHLLPLSYCAMHTNYRLPILCSMGVEEYSDEYIAKLEKLATQVVQQALGLPVMLGD